MHNLDFSQNHFELFGVEATYHIDLPRIDQLYREIQAQIHPDKFAHASDAEKRLSIQWTTHVNEAYQILKQPLARARYILKIHGVDTQEETNTAMPADFLMQQMEWREAIMEARGADDIGELDRMAAKLRHEINELHQSLEHLIDSEKNYESAAGAVRKLKFLEKLREEINDAIEQLEA
jgi:molecular chaperone HscB